MFSIQNCNRFNWRLFPNLFFNKSSNAMICFCSNKCSFPFIIRFKKVAPLEEQQNCQFRPTKIVRNSSGIASSLPSLDVLQNEATAKNEEFPNKKEDKIEMEQQQHLKKAGKREEIFEPGGKETVGGVVHGTLAKRSYSCGKTRRKLHVNYEMGRSGRKFLHIMIGIEGYVYNFANICVPEDVFGFVRAMDRVLEAVDAKRSFIEAPPKHQERFIFYVTKSKGVTYDYRLELYVFNNTVQVQIQTMPNEHNPEHKSRFEIFPLYKFHWLRHAIGELIAANSGENVQQHLGKPPAFPYWLSLDGIPFVSLIKDNQSQQRPNNSTNLGFAQQRGIGQPPLNNSVGYNNQNQYNSDRNQLPDNRRNLQLSQPQNMQFEQRQLPQRVAPVQQQIQQPAQQLKIPPSSAPMSDQLLQLVFLQQQQLQQIHSTFLKDQPMGGVGGAIAQKMGPDNTILMSDLLAQAKQPQIAMLKWSTNNNSVGYRENLSGNRYSSNQGYRIDDEHCD